MGDQVWVTDQRFELLGTTFRVLTQDQPLADRLAGFMAGFPQVATAARARNIVQITGRDGMYTAYHDCRKLAADAGADYALSATVAGLNNAAIAQCAHFAVHSGVVSRGDRIVALPAASGGGKTTLTASLLRQGFGYLSDEALVMDDSGRALPYPKPIALTRWSADLLGIPAEESETLVTASDLGSGLGDGGSLTDIVVAEYGHGEIRLEPLTRSRAVATLIQYSFNHYKDPERSFRIATETARSVSVWKLGYDDPLEAAAALSDALG